MMKVIDDVLDTITMYRLVLFVLLAFIGVAEALALFGLLPFSPVALLFSVGFLVIMCWGANTLLAQIFAIPTNVESAFITALILALIIDPLRSTGDLLFLGWAAILAMSSKYILAIYNKHIFNPAAIAVVITALALGEPASWWVGTGSMLPVIIIGGFLIVRKLRQEAMVGIFLAIAVVTESLVSVVSHLAIARELEQLVVASPLIFFAAIMLTEPLTAPPTRNLKNLYGLLTGFLIIPQIHIGSLYSTPELALVIANVFAYLVSFKQRVVFKLRRKNKSAGDIVDFVFTPSRRLAFAPGQYMEFTLGHPNPDARGNRRYFTLASSPTEETMHLGVRFYEQGSSFKCALFSLNPQTKLFGAQIAGDFTLPPDPAQKLAFIAGGIGITPYRSMLKYLLDTSERRDIVLLYANRKADEIVYKDVLNEAQKKLGVRTIFTLTDTSAIPANWSGLVGRIDAAMIAASIPDYAERTFYVSGPPALVKASEQALRSLSIRRDRIKKDFFPGLV